MTGSPPGAGDAGSVPSVHLLTDDRILARDGFDVVLRWLLRSGGSELAVHLRGPGTTGRRLFEIAGSLAPVAAESGATLVVNDRVDVARAAGLAHVQLGQRSLGVGDARTVMGEAGRIGVSVHSADEARAADGADWLLVGTLWETASHPGRPGAGPGRLEEVGEVCDVPLIGVGGVTPGRVPWVKAAGGRGVAVLAGVWSAPDPVAALNTYLVAWSDT